MPQSSSSATKTQARPALVRARGLDLRAIFPRLVGLAALGGAAWWLLFSGPSSDRPPTLAEDAARATSYDRVGRLVLKPVQPHERSQALQSMQLPADQQQAIEQRRTELVWLTVWDDEAEDGDRITVESDGFRKTLVLTNAQQSLAIPKPRAGLVTLTGVYDGGGGITAAAATSAGQVGLPRLAPSQTIMIPVQ